MSNEVVTESKLAAGEATFRVGPLVNLARVLLSLGYEPGPIFKQAGYELRDFQDPDRRQSYVRASRLLELCVEATGCECFGLMLGKQADPSMLGIAGFLARVAPDVEHALQGLVENINLHEDRGFVQLSIGAKYTSLGYTLQLSGVSAIEQVNDLSLSVLYKVLRALCGEQWVAARIMLERREPEDLSPYRRYFQTALHFNSTENSIAFPSHYLKQKPPTADALLYKHLQGEVDALHGLAHHEIMDDLPAALNRGLLSHKFAAQDIADGFGIHERTFHRRLKVAGTSFRRELDRTRNLVSQQLLVSTSLPVYDIATALGYADSSGFIRAFQRWTGMSPSAWRRQNNTR